MITTSQLRPVVYEAKRCVWLPPASYKTAWQHHHFAWPCLNLIATYWQTKPVYCEFRWEILMTVLCCCAAVCKCRLASLSLIKFLDARDLSSYQYIQQNVLTSTLVWTSCFRPIPFESLPRQQLPCGFDVFTALRTVLASVNPTASSSLYLIVLQ
jgi:hypothetical protein